VTLFGHVAALKETATRSGNRMAFLTLEDMAGTVEVTVFPEPYKAAAPLLRSRDPVVVRGRVDDGDKGRVVLAEDVRLLEQSLGGAGTRARNGGEAMAFRVRVQAGEDSAERVAALRRVCEEHPGAVPVFVHVLLPTTEVVMRSRGASVEATSDLVARVEELLGTGTTTIDYAGRA
jgi:DNA polymerase-3 subunit alpha